MDLWTIFYIKKVAFFKNKIYYFFKTSDYNNGKCEGFFSTVNLIFAQLTEYFKYNSNILCSIYYYVMLKYLDDEGILLR